MLENIAIIKEVHELKATVDAQEEATQYLKKIHLESIGTNRLTQCSELEIFYIMLIRALMTKEMNAIISAPFSLINNLREVKTLLKNIEILNNGKNILILDINSNESHYIGSSCTIIR